jgi:hypothetical protein
MRKLASAVACFVFMALLGFGSAHADQTAFQTGGFTWSYSGDTVGWEFNVASPITVTSLGYLDFNGALQDSHEVAIWDISGNLIASATVLPADPMIANFSCQSITPVVLPAGSYVEAAFGTSPDPWGNGATYLTYANPISFVAYLIDPNGNPTLTFPTYSEGNYGGENVYALSNFTFTESESPAPIPGAFLLLAPGLGGLAFVRRRIFSLKLPQPPITQ